MKTTASEATFVSLLAGRTEAIRRYKNQFPELEDAEINSRLVGYCSDQVISFKLNLEQSKLDYFLNIKPNEINCVTVMDRLTAPWKKPA
jgi:Pyridoxal-dependent decarboxylase conserved domain